MKKMTRILTIAMIAFLALFQTGLAQYQGWKHTGSLYILTTPEGANVPATALEENFPLLVRLNKEWFDFSQAKGNGEDIRFTDATGTPLAYQIENWDAAAGNAAIWLRIPEIKGNTRQEVKMVWGKADALSESKGSAVFNEKNGYLSVFHLDDPTKDATGMLEAKDHDTTPAAGMIGQGRHFEPGKGITCGENITTFPTGSNPHSSEAWFRIEQSNTPILAWGNDAPQGKVITRFASPPHVLVETWFSGADVHGRSKIPLSQWTHVIHTYKNGESRIYVNGVLDGSAISAGAPLAIKSPARLYIGGWYNNYTCLGEIDEVRISKVTRSADWVKLQYENQKDMQTAVGPLVQPGIDFAVSTKKIALTEGKSITVTAKAGGAQKIYWMVKRGTQETLVATDRFSFTLEAGRVTGDEEFTLQFKAVYAQEVKTVEIPVTVKEDIPDPVYTLQAPTKWDGRTPIEVVSQITNLQTLKSKGVGELETRWNVSGMATIKEMDAGKLKLLRANNSGIMTVTATVSNGGKPVTQAHRIMVKEPAKDLWVQRTPGRDEKPVNNQFFARDDKNEGTLHYNGTLSNAADSVFVKLYADDKLIRTESRKSTADKSYAFTLKLKAGLIKYKVELGTKLGGAETVLNTVTNLICGDAYIVNGQSNAVAYNYANEQDRPELTGYSSTWIRSFGGNGEAGELAEGWGNAVIQRLTPEAPDRVCFIGVWCMAMAKKVMEDERIPICILNGAVGGTRIDEHMPDPTNHLNPTKRSIYRNLLLSVAAANLTHGIRGVLWHQGESDQGADGPDGGFGCDTYQQYFMDLTAAWKLDFPNIQHYYVYQIWPNSCLMGGNGASDTLRDIERTFTRLYSNLGVMSTLDLLSGACHFNVADYEKMGISMARLVQRDNYGRIFDKPITPPDLQKAAYTSDKKDEIALVFDQPVVWSDELTSQFYLDGKAGMVVAGSVSGKVITLKLAAPSTAKTITYLVDKHWDIKNILYGQNNIAALTFCGVVIESK
jgi:hypothetical protein